MKKRATILATISLIGLISGIIILWKGRTQDIASSSNPIPIRIRYGFTINNKTNTLVENAKFYAFAPAKASSVQTCNTVESTHPFEKIEDALGNQYLLFKLEKMPPYSSRIITITTDISLFRSPAKQSITTRDQFLRPEQYIPSDHPDIVTLANSLDTGNSQKTVQNYFQWVADHIQYERSTGSPKGALYALTRLKGDCTEYADLLTALCRAAKIPARSIGGYVCPQNAVLKPAEYHNWSEVYYKGKWHIADPQKKQMPESNTEYIATKIIHTNEQSDLPQFDKYWVSDPALRVKMN